ncbi:MAG: roadblock/LC7 domain-containing protein [Candidatus Asgardarchaeia archaeon]
MMDEETLVEIQKLVKEIEEKTDLRNVCIVSKEGTKILSSRSVGKDVDESSAAVAAILNIAQRSSERIGGGMLVQVLIRGEKGYTIITRITPEMALVAYSLNQHRLGLNSNLLIRYGYKMASMMSERRAPLKKEEVVKVSEAESPFAPARRDVSIHLSSSMESAMGGRETITPIKYMGTGESEKILEVHPTPEVSPTIDKTIETQKTNVKLSDEERKAILEALRIIGMIEDKD